MSSINSSPSVHSVNTHSYFEAANKDDQMEKFLTGQIDEPKFEYGNKLSIKNIDEKLMSSSLMLSSLNKLALVRSSELLQTDNNELERFRQINEHLYSIPTLRMAEAIVSQIRLNSNQEDIVLFDEAIQCIGLNEYSEERAMQPIIRPSQEIFDIYRNFFQRFVDITVDLSNNSAIELIGNYLKVTRLSENGWRIKILAGSSHARTNHRTKTIRIGKDYKPRLDSSKLRIAIHEVYGHALRGPQKSIAESEGFAIVLEQLLKTKFSYRRGYRYLAASIGYGVFGHPMTFRQTHSVLWRFMVIGSRYTYTDAKQHAFNECYRVFRGGRPDLAGAVYLKDTIYFSANIEMWNKLSRDILSYDQFKNLLQGEGTIL